MLRALRGEPPEPFAFAPLGALVSLGRGAGVAELRGRQFSGPLAWALWRGVYLAKLPGLERKVRVLIDWALELAFAHDIVLTADPAPALAPAPERRGAPEANGGAPAPAGAGTPAPAAAKPGAR